MRNETVHENAIEIAKRLLASGKMNDKEIAEMVKLPVEEIEALDHKKSA